MQKIIIHAITMLILCGISNCSDLPNLFKSKKFTTKDISEAVNHFQSMGEKQAVISLINVGWDSSSVQKQGFSTRERAFWIASLLYRPRDPSDNMYIGGLSLPILKNKYLDWYYYPLIDINGCYFVLSEGISGAGAERGIVEYIANCQQFGKFRENQIKILNLEESRDILDNFFVSKKWIDLFKKDDLSSMRQKLEIEQFMSSQIKIE